MTITRNEGQACPSCRSGRTKVTNSRVKEGSIRRRRECLDCTGRFSTLEVQISEHSGATVTHMAMREAKAARYDHIVAITGRPFRPQTETLVPILVLRDGRPMFVNLPEDYRGEDRLDPPWKPT